MKIPEIDTNELLIEWKEESMPVPLVNLGEGECGSGGKASTRVMCPTKRLYSLWNQPVFTRSLYPSVSFSLAKDKAGRIRDCGLWI